MGDLTGANKAAKKQAAATTKAAELQAQSDLLAAQQSQASTETMIAQDKAAKAAAEMLSTPTEQVDVSLGSNADPGTTVDTATGKRRTIRQTFQAPATSGIKI
jgi:hypothetical protein